MHDIPNHVPQRRGRPASGQADTRQRIIQAAERMFAQRGTDGPSLREIAAAAGQRNTTAVQYHFGSKEQLIYAIFEYRLQQMEPQRKFMLELAEQNNRLSDARTLLEILHLPYLRMTDEQGNHVYAAFLSEYVLRQRPRGVKHPIDDRTAFSEALQRVLDLMAARLFYLPQAIIDSRLVLCNGMFLNMLVRHDTERALGHITAPLPVLVEDTLDIMTAAFCNQTQHGTNDWSGWHGQ